MKRRWLATAFVSLLILTSCGDDPPPAGNASPNSTEATTTTSNIDTGAAELDIADRLATHRLSEPEIPEITLISAGEEPRRELRIDVAEGTTEAFTMEMTQDQRIEIPGHGSQRVAMTFAIDLVISILSVADGLIETEMTYGDIRLIDGGALSRAEVRQVEAAMAPLEGLSFFATLDDRGTTLSLYIPRNISGFGPEVEQMMNEFEVPSLPLPVEAVGVGARWSVATNPAPLADMPMPMVTEYELVELHDDHFVVNQHAVVTFEPSTMRQGGVTAEFHSGEMVSTGTMTWWFNSMQAMGETKAQGSIAFTESDATQSVDGEMFIKARVVMRPQS